MKKHSFLILLSFFLPLFYNAQNLDPIKWEAKYTDAPNNEGLITITATIEPNWHIYSQREVKDGPIPTSFKFTPGKDLQLVGKTEEEGAKEEFDKAFDAKLYTFEHKAVFKQKVKRLNAKAFTSPVKLEFMTCNGMQCLPPKNVDLSVSVAAAKK